MNYPTKPIGGDNPYHQCAHCGVSMPEIDISGHRDWCKYNNDNHDRLLNELVNVVIDAFDLRSSDVTEESCETARKDVDKILRSNNLL